MSRNQPCTAGIISSTSWIDGWPRISVSRRRYGSLAFFPDWRIISCGRMEFRDARTKSASPAPCRTRLCCRLGGHHFRCERCPQPAFCLCHALRCVGGGIGGHSSPADGGDSGSAGFGSPTRWSDISCSVIPRLGQLCLGSGNRYRGICMLAAALLVLRLSKDLTVTMAGAFLAGFVAYEGVLLAATAVLPSGEGAFSAAVVADVLLNNSLAAIGLICLHAGAAAGRALVARQPGPVLS